MSRHTITGNLSENLLVMMIKMHHMIIKDVYLGEAPGSGRPMPGLGPTPGGKVGPAAGPGESVPVVIGWKIQEIMTNQI